MHQRLEEDGEKNIITNDAFVITIVTDLRDD